MQYIKVLMYVIQDQVVKKLQIRSCHQAVNARTGHAESPQFQVPGVTEHNRCTHVVVFTTITYVVIFVYFLYVMT